MRLERVIVLIAVPCLTGAQQVPTIRLERAAATHAGEWTDVAGVFELNNGKLVVLDARDRSIKLADMTTGAATMIGRRGPGPGEYELPIHMFGLPGDSAIVVDMANNGRPLVITPGGISNYMLTSRTTPFITDASVADARGRIYRTGLLMAELGTTGASGPAIERLDRRNGRIDTIAYISRSSRACAFTGAPSGTGAREGFARASDAPQRAYAMVEQWAVAPDGRVAIVCPSPYRVLIVDSTRRRIDGPVISYDPVPLTEREKAEWREARQQPVASLVSNANGRMVASYTRRPAPPEPEWPAVLPPFEPGRRLNGAAFFAPDGLLWVRRMVAAGAPSQYDIIGRDGALSYRVVMPPRTRVVGFGNRGIYAVTVDADDLQRLARFTFPPMNNR